MTMVNLQPRDAEDFRGACSAIASRWRGMLRDKERPIVWLERVVYELTEHLIAYDLYDELTAPCLQLLSRRGRSKPVNRFGQVIRVIFFNEGNAPSDQVRSRIARRLEYAYWHFIPPEFLTAFLKEVGSEPKLGEVKSGYERWLKAQLQERRNSESVWLYPKGLRPKKNDIRVRYWRELEGYHLERDSK